MPLHPRHSLQRYSHSELLNVASMPHLRGVSDMPGQPTKASMFIYYGTTGGILGRGIHRGDHARAAATDHELSESVRLIVSRRFLYASSCSSCVPLCVPEPRASAWVHPHPHRRRRTKNAERRRTQDAEEENEKKKANSQLRARATDTGTGRTVMGSPGLAGSRGST